MGLMQSTHSGQDQRRTPPAEDVGRSAAAEQVGALAAGDLALRFVECFGFEELARTGARVNKRWHAASLVFAPPEAEFRQRPGPREVFDGYRALSRWSTAPGWSANNIHTPTADAVKDPFSLCFQNGYGAYVIDPGTSSIGSFAAFVELLITENVEGQVLVTMREADFPKWVEVFQDKPYFRGNPVTDDDFRPTYRRGQMRVYLWPHGQVKRWGETNIAVWKIVVVDIGDRNMRSRRFSPATLERLDRTSGDKYIMCRSLPPGGLRVSEMLLRGLFLNEMVFRPLYEKFLDYLCPNEKGMLRRADTPEKRYVLELMRRDLAKYLADEFPQTINVQDLRGTQLARRWRWFRAPAGGVLKWASRNWALINLLVSIVFLWAWTAAFY